MKALMRLCVPAVLGAVTLFGAAATAKAADAPASQSVQVASAASAADGPYVFESDALRDAHALNALGINTLTVQDDDGFWWVVY